MNDNNTERNTIDLVLFLSQTTDNIIPAKAQGLQHKLGLPIYRDEFKQGVY
ncbi:MAG: hypothetical protein WCO13_11150 [Bacteroidota bacterium]